MTAVSQGLHDQGRREDVAATAAQLGGDRKALDPEPGAGLPRLQGELARLLTFRQVLVELGAGEGGRCLLQLTLLGAQRELHPSPCSLAEPCAQPGRLFQPASAPATRARGDPLQTSWLKPSS